MLDLDALYGFHEELAGGVRSPRVNSALTYLAEIECYHPDDDANPDNLIYWSEQLSESAWDSPGTGAATVTADATTDPNGGTTADMLTFVSTGVSGRYQDVNVDSATEYTFSVYVKLGTSIGPNLNIRDMTNGATIYGTGGITGVSSSTWTRCSFTFTTPAGCKLIRVYPVRDSGLGTLYMWGCMLNTGATAGTYTKRDGAPTRTLRFSSLPYTSQIDDAPAQTHYESRLLQPGLIRRDLFSPGQPAGAISVGYGLVEILNTGDLDEYTAASFDGRSYVLKIGRIDQPLRDFTTVLKATMESAEFTFSRMTIKLRDRLAELNNPVTTKKYLGDSTSLEGDADLKDRFKPLIFGDVQYITPVLTDEALQTYQLSSNPIDTTGILILEGGQLAPSRGADYTSSADMIANAPAANQYRVWPEGGFVRLQFTPNQILTARVYAADASRNVGDCLKLLAMAAGWPAAEINSADVTALNSDAAGTTNLFIDNGGNALDLMNALAQGRGIWFGPDRLGVLRMGLLQEPSGTPDLSLTSTDIISIERQSPSTLPAKQVIIKKDKNWTVHSEFSALVGSTTRQWLSNEWRQTVATDSTNQISRKLASTIELESLINANEADTASQAYRLLALYSAPRDIMTVRLRARVVDTLLLDLNDVVSITYPRFGMDAGKLFRVLGIQADYRLGQLDLTLWG